MANRSVVLYLRTRIEKEWAYRKVSEELSELAAGEYYLSWYIEKRKHLEPVGSNPEAALAALNLKRLELAYVASGGRGLLDGFELRGVSKLRRLRWWSPADSRRLHHYFSITYRRWKAYRTIKEPTSENAKGDAILSSGS